MDELFKNYYEEQHTLLYRAIDGMVMATKENNIAQSYYVLEECGELIQAIIKEKRGKGSQEDIINESCDVICSILTMLYQYNVPLEQIISKIIYKCNRAAQRIDNGEKP